MGTYLQLAPEHGGSRFGPFMGGTIQIGTDASRCQIVVAALPGIAPVHAALFDHGNGSYTVQPVQRGLGLFLVQRGQTHRLESAVTAQSGDTLILGDAAGPRFTLRFDSRQDSRGAGPIRPQRNFGDAFAREAGRQVSMRLMSRVPYVRELHTIYYRYSRGGLRNPRLLMGVFSAIFFVVITGIISCVGVIGAVISAL